MKRTNLPAVVLACGLLATSIPAYAQTAPVPPKPGQTTPAPDVPALPAPNWFQGDVNLMPLGRDDVSSSKFQEYRVVPNGMSMPVFSLQGSRNDKEFALAGKNISQKDQRYTGRANTGWLAVAFDYNQVPHNMGNDGQTLFTETSAGVWTMSPTVRQALGSAVDAVPTSARNYPFYSSLLASTFASANSLDLSGLRQRGNVNVDITKNLPFDLAFTYMREVKTGYRGASGGDVMGVVTTSVDAGERMNEVTTDYGVRAAYNFKAGNVHATFNRNLYNDRLDALVIDNPFRATDLAYTSTSVPGGPAQARFSTSPDNEASRGAFGAQLKFARQTRLMADVALGTWTQNAPFLPYTINSVIATGTGLPANSTASLQRPSLNGKINTTSVNLGFLTRPAEGLGIRLRYRSYGYKDKSARYVITGDTSGSPDRLWSAADAPTADDPYGHATANRTDASTGRFDAQVSYDIKDLTLEGGYRNHQSSWVGRNFSSGTDNKENGYTLAAVFHARDWVGFRGTFDQAKRTVSGFEPTARAATQGVMADHAEREATRTGLDIELTPSGKYGVTFAYFRRNDDYPNRPNRRATAAGSPEIPGTPSGLLNAKYDTYSVDFDFTPNERAELSAFYTYEKTVETNQWATLTGTALNNQLNYRGSDKGNTFGVNAVIHLVPEKWTFSTSATHQKVNGLMDITAREAGSFYTPGRTTLIPAGTGGAQDITDYDDTKLTNVMVDLAYNANARTTLSLGYAYEKYDYADAFNAETSALPQSVLTYLKANDGPYKANVGYLRLSYRF
ncbi:MAG: hypothetical protein A3H96_18800 [Acidobacteria bacterium RIFCSPLOWO2_02_FULL_67_36]|nr:MAG: hypothetical protein A3H96_18800 [Acidobacteria bacterium RIFCSPLOWO2_02_FULL_67_36]